MMCTNISVPNWVCFRIWREEKSLTTLTCLHDSFPHDFILCGKWKLKIYVWFDETFLMEKCVDTPCVRLQKMVIYLQALNMLLAKMW